MRRWKVETCSHLVGVIGLTAAVLALVAVIVALGYTAVYLAS